ncbi:serine/threonine protein kinase [Waterburya agarophytonicola K14]|uniref:non-specific serine/threonine protein kinase n=1 Tax=Waterburya agarophytonicola KI4 TaxID=2874699 RepID=A0A964BP42_9CYAN|nr:serine/threonine-protein kinase [Waterburya agarophytonicola]MCC0176211.1 serine/threonine protein kinase [Waterburya agarophytonicola KI4]
MDNNLVGQTIQGRYYVVKQLGRGGVGVTFVAQDQQCFDSLCVVKQLKPKSASDKTLEIARRLFNREAEIMNRLGDCDRIPRLLAYFEHQNDFFLVQELIEGQDLSNEIIAGQPWSEEKTIGLLKDILEVLQVVQQYSVIHRDLKPSNLMRRDKDKKIVLIDFGSVKQVSTQIVDAAGEVKQTVAVGTKSYMPMEQMMGRPGFYSDIYAVGVIAIQALTGIPPKRYTISQDGELIWRSLLDPNVSYRPQFLNILDKMVRYRHQERYSSAGVVLSDLKQLDDKTILVPKKNHLSTSPKVPSTHIISGGNPQANGAKNGSTLIINNGSGVANNGKNSTPNQVTNNSQTATKKPPLKLFGAIAAAAVAIGGLGFWLLSQSENPEPETNLSLYENASEGFRVDYPEAWSKQNRDDFFATGVVFFSPLEDESDQFKERVSVLVENLSEEVSLDGYTERSITEIKKLSDPYVGEAKFVNFGEDEGRQVVYTGEENGNTVQKMQTWSVKEDKAYVITYTARIDSYNSYLPTVEKMIESFETISN